MNWKTLRGEQMDTKLREQLIVTLGYLLGLNGKPVGNSAFGGVEKIYVPKEVIEPLRKLLFPSEENKDDRKS